MEPRLSLITLGVDDVSRARRFYERWLEWEASPSSNQSVCFIQLNGLALSLYGRADLAADAHLPDARATFGGITLAYNVRSKTEVDQVLAAAVAAGARLLKPAQDVFWGGYAGYFADPDGHPWEVAWNPHFALDPQGNLHLPQ